MQTHQLQYTKRPCQPGGRVAAHRRHTYIRTAAVQHTSHLLPRTPYKSVNQATEAKIDSTKPKTTQAKDRGSERASERQERRLQLQKRPACLARSVSEKKQTNLEVASRHADEHEGPLTGLDLPPQKVVQQPAVLEGRGAGHATTQKDKCEAILPVRRQQNIERTRIRETTQKETNLKHRHVARRLAPPRKHRTCT